MIDQLKDRGFLIKGILHLSPEEVFEICSKGGILVDLRDSYLSNFKSFGVPEVLYLPAGKIREEYKKLPRDKYMIFSIQITLSPGEA